MLQSNPLPADLSPRWKQLYAAAVLELDDTKLPERIAKARAAMPDRAEDSLASSSSEERRTLNNALRVLRVLEKMTSRKPAA